MKTETIRITTGIYNTEDYKVVKEFKSEKPAIKFLQTIGYPYNEVMNETWSHQGKQYKLSIG